MMHADNINKKTKSSHRVNRFSKKSEIERLKNFHPKERVRFVTATSLFDGHDASINIMRRILQARGAEIIHLGHNRSAGEVVQAALQEDVQGIAVSSYQGGHNEYFQYMRKLLNENGGEHIKIFAGGGGVISLAEIDYLEKNGVEKIYSPEDGFKLGLDGIIGDMLDKTDCRFSHFAGDHDSQKIKLSRGLTLLEGHSQPIDIIKEMVGLDHTKKAPVLGITGTGGAGKSSLLDEILLRFLYDFNDIKIGIICVDPSKKKTGGALLGDRIRINSCSNERIYLRSFASRQSGKELATVCKDAVEVLQTQDFDLIIVETSGIGQGDTGILDVSDMSLYVMTPEYGASTQLEKIDMLDFADIIAINKYERRQGPDALRDIRTLLRRNRYQGQPQKDEDYPVFGTIASRFNDDGVSGLYVRLLENLSRFDSLFERGPSPHRPYSVVSTNREALIPSNRENYLAEISECIREYNQSCENEVELVRKFEALKTASEIVNDKEIKEHLENQADEVREKIEPTLYKNLIEWKENVAKYNSDHFQFQVRNKNISVESSFETLSHLKLPRVATPNMNSLAELAKFIKFENMPGYFPYAGGIFPFRRKQEDPKRQFAGEGGPQRTNARFHYLSEQDIAKRLSTAFDSVTLYGHDPDERPDIYGKVGESGVSIAHLQDMRDLFAGFDLCSPTTSVSMTINGPAPMLLAMFLNTAIDQQVDKFTESNNRKPNANEIGEIRQKALVAVRGTVQADILKEDQAQNTCIFSIEFALRLMADVQEYFIENSIKNYYAVSISGYHIAEAGANPITQLAFTLANGFTYVEYYLKRGMDIDDFASNLSFFFSNGIDVEYSVLGRVARRIWAIAMKKLYKANNKSQKLKYHIQTSGRSLHAQEMSFNDIRTTLQALMALYDNCNSLHTNAYDEAVTTPTEESVRRAMAIQMIINHEFGLNKCENVNQGSFFIEQLTGLVEEAVLKEFERISSRGGVLGAMETQYQRAQIQEESMHYEHLKHNGQLPIIEVNTYLNRNGNSDERAETNLVRSSYEEKDDQLSRLEKFKEKNHDDKSRYLKRLEQCILEDQNIFAELMTTVRYCSLGEITHTLFKLGGEYRRAM